jgi:hypothetical protein
MVERRIVRHFSYQPNTATHILGPTSFLRGCHRLGDSLKLSQADE